MAKPNQAGKCHQISVYDDKIHTIEFLQIAFTGSISAAGCHIMYGKCI